MPRSVFLILALLLLALGAAPATSSARSFTMQFGRNDTGDITMAANTLMTCPGSCSEANAAANTSSTATSLNDNGQNMVFVDADGDPATTVSSSTATLSLPADATVLSARLYWGARTSAGTNGAPAQSPSQRDQIKLKVPGGSYATITASAMDDAGDGTYSAVADVTGRVDAAGGGLYSVGDIQAGTGQDRMAGWALVVAYRDPAAPPRNLTIFDGFTTISSSHTSEEITVSGFETPPAGAVDTRVGAVSYEGDLASRGDELKLRAAISGAPTGSYFDLSNAVNPADNAFNSTVSVDGAQVTTGRSPNQLNHFGFDADIFPAPSGSIPNGATTAQIRVATGGETFYPAVLTFATTLYAPKVRPVTTVTDLNGGNVEPGDVLRYTTTGRNVGTDTAIELTSTDEVAGDLELLDGTLQVAGAGAQTIAAGDDLADWDPSTRRLTWRVGSGAGSSAGGSLAPNATFEYSYDVRVGAPANGAHVGGPATATYEGQALGDEYTVTGTGGSVSVAGPDLAMDVTRSGALTRGGTATYALAVANVGAAPTGGTVQVVDDLPAGLELDGTPSGTGWSCSVAGSRLTCTRSDVLAAGASYPPISVPVRVRQDAASPLANAATVSGGSDGVHSNDTDGDSAAAASDSALSLALSAPPASIAPGETQTLTATVANDGPSDALATAVAFTAPADMELVSASVGGAGCVPASCAVGTVAAHGSATVTLVVRARRSAHGSTQQIAGDVTTASNDTTSGDDHAAASVVVRELRPVSVTQTVTPGTLVAGSPVHIAIRVDNAGPTTATGVQLSEALPAELRDVQVTAPAGGTCSVLAGTLRCQLPALADGAHAIVGIDAGVAPGAAGSTLTMTAQVDPVAADPDHSDDAATTTRTVSGVADLALLRVDSPSQVAAGTTGTWTLRAVNDGPSSAPDAVVRLPIPAGAEFAGADGAGCAVAGGVLECALGALAPGDDAQVAIRLAVAHDTRPGDLTLDPVASSDAPDPDSADATVRVVTPIVRSVDLEAFQSNGGVAVVAGTRASFTSTVANAGPSDASDVVVTQVVPAGMSGATATIAGAGGSCTVADGVARCIVPVLASGERATIVLSGAVAAGAAGATLQPTVRAQAAEPDADASDDEAVDPATAIAVTDLGVTAKAPQSTVFAGTTAPITLTVTNDGPSDAAGVVVTKELPPAAEVVSLDPRCSVSGQVITCRLESLPVGEQVALDITVRARKPFDGSLLAGNAEVRGSGGDPVAANDTLGEVDLSAACSSLRRFPITLRFPRRLSVRKAVVRVDGRRVKVQRKGGRWVAVVDLRGKTKPRVTVTIVGRTKAGRRITGKRVYHPCALRIKHTRPPKV